jgi:hypothetical protein
MPWLTHCRQSLTAEVGVQVYVGFVVNSMVLEQGTLPEVPFSLSVSFHRCSNCMLLLPEGQTDVAWEPPKSNALSEFEKARLEQNCEGRKWVVGTGAQSGGDGG